MASSSFPVPPGRNAPGKREAIVLARIVLSLVVVGGAALLLWLAFGAPPLPGAGRYPRVRGRGFKVVRPTPRDGYQEAMTEDPHQDLDEPGDFAVITRRTNLAAHCDLLGLPAASCACRQCAGLRKLARKAQRAGDGP
jgi:hypothetical protein